MSPRLKSSLLILSLVAVVVLHGCVRHDKPDIPWPYINSPVKKLHNVESRVDELLAGMTVEQKVAQIIQPEIRDITVEDMRKYGFGSYLNGGGAFPNNNKHATPADWIALAEAMYQASVDDSIDGSNIPTMWGTDAVHGHNNVIGATIFPHNIGLGAANNPALIRDIARVTATEVMVTGIDWVFAPTVATVRDDRWGRTYEGYSEDPDIVKAYAQQIVMGLQGEPGKDFLDEHRVISTVKHFIGDGGTVDGDDQGNNVDEETALYQIHGQGYVSGLAAGAQSVMASFNSWHGKKIHGSQYLLTEVLKGKMGFDGFVVGDWNGHGQIKGCTNESCPQAMNAGLDVFMAPTPSWKPLYENTLAQVKSGEIPVTRLDDAVRRLLRVKVRAGLFDKPSPANRPVSGKTELIGATAHREVARKAVRESLVLLKNKNSVLPLSPKLNILVAGDGADNIGKQSGGWTITWQGTNNTNEDFPGGSSIWDGLKVQVKAAGGQIELSEDGQYQQKPDVAIVVFGEDPYAEGHGDRKNLMYQPGTKKDLKLLQRLKNEGITVVSVFLSGRPMYVNAELNNSDAFVAAWLPGSEGSAIADVLLRNAKGNIQHDFSGALSFSWPATPDQIVNRFDSEYAPLLPYGFGLTYSDENLLGDELPQISTDDAAADKEVSLLKGSTQSPWQLYLFSGQQQQRVSAASQSFGDVSFRTIDRFVQEDAINISVSNGTADGIRVLAENGFRQDMAAMQSGNRALMMDIRVNAGKADTITLGAHCEAEADSPGSCRASFNLTEAISQLQPDSWHSFAVPVSCFTQQGLDFGKLVMAFELSVKGNADISVGHVRYAGLPEDKTGIVCP